MSPLSSLLFLSSLDLWYPILVILCTSSLNAPTPFLWQTNKPRVNTALHLPSFKTGSWLVLINHTSAGISATPLLWHLPPSASLRQFSKVCTHIPNLLSYLRLVQRYFHVILHPFLWDALVSYFTKKIVTVNMTFLTLCSLLTHMPILHSFLPPFPHLWISSCSWRLISPPYASGPDPVPGSLLLPACKNSLYQYPFIFPYHTSPSMR